MRSPRRLVAIRNGTSVVDTMQSNSRSVWRDRAEHVRTLPEHSDSVARGRSRRFDSKFVVSQCLRIGRHIGGRLREDGAFLIHFFSSNSLIK